MQYTWKASKMEKLRVKFTLQQAMKVQSGSRDTDLLSFNLGARL
jgi:hypothetical protein